MSIIDTIMSALRSLTGGGTGKSTGASGSTGPESKGQVSTEYDPTSESESASAAPDVSAEADEGTEVDGTDDTETAADSDSAGPVTDRSTEPVETITGIGPAYGGRLAECGIETVGELAAADAADVAEGIDVSESRVSDWVERANDAS
jgi:predicted flap endonuclease-1-like 5' DNA nuclease